MFFENWTDKIGENSIEYKISSSTSAEFIRVNFAKKEDAIMMRLSGIPDEFQKYLKFADEIKSIDNSGAVLVN